MNLVIFNKCGLEITKCSNPLVSIDVTHLPLQINGPIFILSLDAATNISKFNFCNARSNEKIAMKL